MDAVTLKIISWVLKLRVQVCKCASARTITIHCMHTLYNTLALKSHFTTPNWAYKLVTFMSIDGATISADFSDFTTK